MRGGVLVTQSLLDFQLSEMDLKAQVEQSFQELQRRRKECKEKVKNYQENELNPSQRKTYITSFLNTVRTQCASSWRKQTSGTVYCNANFPLSLGEQQALLSLETGYSLKFRCNTLGYLETKYDSNTDKTFLASVGDKTDGLRFVIFRDITKCKFDRESVAQPKRLSVEVMKWEGEDVDIEI